jgi:hypothetical protein
MTLNRQDREEIVTGTLDHYNQLAEYFWKGTRDHDVSQSIKALLWQRRPAVCHPRPRARSTRARPGLWVIRLCKSAGCPVRSLNRGRAEVKE